MQIVIDIPDNEYYDTLQCVEWSANTDFENLMIRALKEGTPLPKGHGDLIDRGKLKTHFIGTEQGTDLEVYLEPTIINAPTIIGADTESEE